MYYGYETCIKYEPEAMYDAMCEELTSDVVGEIDRALKYVEIPAMRELAFREFLKVWKRVRENATHIVQHRVEQTVSDIEGSPL